MGKFCHLSPYSTKVVCHTTHPVFLSYRRGKITTHGVFLNTTNFEHFQNMRPFSLNGSTFRKNQFIISCIAILSDSSDNSGRFTQ